MRNWLWASSMLVLSVRIMSKSYNIRTQWICSDFFKLVHNPNRLNRKSGEERASCGGMAERSVANV